MSTETNQGVHPKKTTFANPQILLAGIFYHQKHIYFCVHEYGEKKEQELTLMLTNVDGHTGTQKEILRNSIRSKFSISLEPTLKLNSVQHPDDRSIANTEVYQLKFLGISLNEIEKAFVRLPLKAVLQDIASGNRTLYQAPNGKKLPLSGLTKHIILECRDLIK